MKVAVQCDGRHGRARRGDHRGEHSTAPVQRVGAAAAAPVRVILAEDDVLLRAGLAGLLERSGFDVVGQASDGAQLLALVRDRTPDLVLTDIRQPDSTPILARSTTSTFAVSTAPRWGTSGPTESTLTSELRQRDSRTPSSRTGHKVPQPFATGRPVRNCRATRSPTCWTTCAPTGSRASNRPHQPTALGRTRSTRCCRFPCLIKPIRGTWARTSRARSASCLISRAECRPT